MITATEPEIRDIGSRRELFVDRFLVDQLNGVRLQLHHPRPAEMAVTLDQPWEKRFQNGISEPNSRSSGRIYLGSSTISRSSSPYTPTPSITRRPRSS